MLLRNAGIYGAVGIVSAGLSFILVPVLTRWLSPADYGLVAIYQTLSAIAVVPIGLGLHGAIARRWFDADRRGIPAFVGTCLVLIAAAAVVVAGVLAVCAGPLSRAIGFPANWMWAAWATALAQAVLLCLLTAAQSAQRPWLYATAQTATVCAIVGGSIMLVVSLEQGWTGRVWANLAAIAAAATASIFVLRRLGWFTPTLRRSDAHRALAFGIPLLPHAIAGWALGNLDRLLAAHILGTEAAGLLLAAWQLALVVSMAEDAFNRAWAPWFMERMRSADAAERIRAAAHVWLYAATLLGMALAVGLSSPWLADWLLGPRFADAAAPAFWYCLAAALGGLYKMAANQLFWAERTWAVTAASSAATLVLVPACIVGCMVGGAIGAALATALAQLALLVITAFLGQRYAPLPWLAGLRAALGRGTVT